MGEKDAAEKILEAYNDVFADIVNGLLFDGETVVRPEELEDQTPRSAYKADGRLREIERDVAKRWTRSSIRIACIGFENQTEPDADMPLRVLSYDGAEYRTQLLRKNRDKPRYPVVTLVLYFGHRKHWDQPRSLYEAVEIPERFRPYVSDVKINLFEIAWLTHEQVARFHSDFRIVADYFVQMRERGDYTPSPEKLDHVQETLQLLSAMTQDRRFEEVYNESIEEGGVQNMCEVLDRVEQRGRAAGIALGEERGRLAGIALGEERGMILGEQSGRASGAEDQARKTAVNLHKLGMKAEQIAAVLELPESKVAAWLAACED